MKKSTPATNPDAYVAALTGWQHTCVESLRHFHTSLKPGGKYEMATIELRAGDSVDSATASRLTLEAVALNASLGDPTDIGK